MDLVSRNKAFVSSGIALGAVVVTLVAGPAAAQAAGSCDLVAAPNGSDSNAGTVEQPLLSGQGLVDRLGAGQIGCFRTGTYATDQEIQIGTSGITLTSYPGERANVRGRIWIKDAANSVTLSDLDLDGRNDGNLPSPTINGDDAVLRGNDITNHQTAICVSLGQVVDWGRAKGTLIEDNRIHDCGRLPATNTEHGIYVNAADNTVIRDNWIYDNADRGIQLYPDSRGTLVTGNVIDGNGQGVIFGGNDESGSSNNTVENNVITNSKIRSNIESSWGGPVGTGNVARNNCVGGGEYDTGNGGILEGTTASLGFSATSNLVEIPPFANSAAGDFTIPDSSPCAALLAGAKTAEVAPQPLAVTIETSKKSVRKLVPVRVSGRAPGAGSVTLVVRRNGDWRRLGRDGTRKDGTYKLRIRLRQSGHEVVKAVAGGLRDSKPVRLRVKA